MAHPVEHNLDHRALPDIARPGFGHRREREAFDRARLILRRAGLIDDTTYLQLVMKTVNQVQQTPGQQVQTAAQASFDAWMKYYRIHENTPNATVSYYTKGALVAMCFDLTLRAEGHSNLDEVMRELWLSCQGGPMREADFARALKRLGGRAFDRELRDWVHGTGDLPVLDLLAPQGAKVNQDKAPLAQQLGLRVGESGGLTLKNVLRGGAAEAAGMAAGDEWLALEADGPQGLQTWRVRATSARVNRSLAFSASGCSADEGTGLNICNVTGPPPRVEA